MATATTEPRTLERRVQLRMRRQQLLTRANPATVHVIIDEAVLRHMIGGPDVMAEQLDTLRQAGQRDNVIVQVLELDAGAHPATGVAFTLFDFDIPAATPVAYQEQLTGNTYIDDPTDIAVFASAWQSATAAAATPRRSHDILTAHWRERRTRPPAHRE